MKIDPTWELPSFTCESYRPKQTPHCLVIPVLNEGERIRRQLIRMDPYAPLADMVVVDGGSSDGALDADYLKRHFVRTFIVKTGGGGLSSQLRLGLAYGLSEGYEGMVLIDGNNKDNPEAIPMFLDLLRKGTDHIQGSRFIPGGTAPHNPLLRVLAIKFIHAPLLSLSAGFRFTDTTNGFRGYSRKFLLDANVQPFRSVFSDYELHYYLAIRAARLGFKVIETPVERAYPAHEEVPSKINDVRGYAKVFLTLLKACCYRFDPPGLPLNPPVKDL